MTDWMKCGAAVLATWRVTHLLADEDGPADIIALVRERLGNSELGALMDCFACMSLWVALPFSFYVARKPRDRVVAWLALSGAACLLSEIVSRGESHELLRPPAPSTQSVAYPSTGLSALSRERAHHGSGAGDQKPL
jgi:hypothetical protein